MLLTQTTLQGKSARNARSLVSPSCLYPEPWIPGGRVLHPGGAWSHMPSLPRLDAWEQWAAATGGHCCRAAPLSNRQQAGETCWSPCTAGQCCWSADNRSRIGRSEIATLHLKEWNGRKLKSSCKPIHQDKSLDS